MGGGDERSDGIRSGDELAGENAMTVGEVAQLITSLGVLVGVVLSYRNGRMAEANKRATQEVHLSINSRMDELLREAKAAAHAAGAAQQSITDHETPREKQERSTQER